MAILLVILAVIAAIVLGFFVLIQNPKGGGLAGGLSGISNQLMGVKQTTDTIEKGTWITAGIIALLCIFSPIFTKSAGGKAGNLKNVETTQPAATKTQAPAPNTVNTTTETTTTTNTTTPTGG